MFEVKPIDRDFAGWSIVEEGQHTDWAVVNMEDFTLVCFDDRKTVCEKKCEELNNA